MRKITGKSKNKTFLKVIALVSASSALLYSCNSKIDVNNGPIGNSQKCPVPEIAPSIEDESIDPDKKVIYLTFDDGPNQGTENLLKILNKRKVCATTFLIGKHTSGSNKQKEDFLILKQNSLIELANHSFTHANNKYKEFYKNAEAVVHDFDIAKDSLKLPNKIARFPGRNIWRLNNINVTDIKSSTAAADSLKKAGYKIIGWDLEWRPSKKMTLMGNHETMLKKVDSIFLNHLEKTSRHLVILVHDQHLRDLDSINELDMFIEKLQRNNKFIFRKISQYPKINEVMN